MNRLIVILSILFFSPFLSASCYQVSVQINENKPNGDYWDRNEGKPDLKACFIDNRSSQCMVNKDDKSLCVDSLNCDLGIIYFSSTSINIVLTDLDITDHDAIGSKECTVGSACNLGNAIVNFSGVSCN
jgi:hypothetical protein